MPGHASLNQRAPLPLRGITVVEICQVAAGPFCAMVLADMGAKIIKIEPPGGDNMRNWPPKPNGYSENFASLNRNKSSIALDLKNHAGRRIALGLISEADVLIENARPGVMKRLGLDYETISKDHQRLVYASISAFGQHGPRAKMGGYDVTVQAVSGVMSVTGEPGRAPVKAGVPIADFGAGLYAATAILAVLNRVKDGGRGDHIDISMQGVSLAMAALQTSEYFGTNNAPRPTGADHPRNAPYGAFMAKDKAFVLAAGNDKLFAAVCAEVGLEGLICDAQFLTPTKRAKNQEALRALLEGKLRQKKARHWIERFQALGVPCEPINDYPSALSDPQVIHKSWVKDITLPGGIKTKTFGSPIGFAHTVQEIYKNPPALDEDRTEILKGHLK